MTAHVFDNFEKEINLEIQKGFIKQIADKIIQGMMSLSNATEDVKRRWVWELLQNAKDVPNRWGKVSIEVNLYKDKIEFKHNGDCFTIKNLTSLIQQVSSKSDQGEDEKVTGKFGTGFITTHLLSPIFILDGYVRSQTGCIKKFQMEVNRNSNQSKDMMELIELALDELRELKNSQVCDEYEEKRKEDDMDTVFTYPLNPTTYTYAKIGVDDLIKVVPYTLIFIPLIKKVTVNIFDGDKKESIIVERDTEIKNEGIEFPSIKETKINKNSEKKKTTYDFVLNSEGKLNIAWPIEYGEESTKIKKIPQDLPKLFCSFPLIGSEGFHQPMVINCSGFYPNEPRNTIFLRANTPEVRSNKDYLIKANTLFKQLINYSTSHNFSNYFYLFVDPPLDNQYIDINWLKNDIFNIRVKFLIEQPLVETYNGMKSIKSMKFPSAPNKEAREKLWDLFKEYYQDGVVIIKDLENWYRAIGNSPYACDIKEFVKMFSGLKNLEGMPHCFSSDELKIKFINRLIAFLKMPIENNKKDNNKNLLRENALIPNIKGRFLKDKDLLSDKNDVIIQKLKDIYYILSEKDLDDHLINHQIDYKVSDYQSTGNTKVSTDINSMLKNLMSKDPKMNDPRIKNAALAIESLVGSSKRDERQEVINYIRALDIMNTQEIYFDKLPNDFWEEADKIVIELMVQKIETFSKNNRGDHFIEFANNCLHKSIDDSLKWMNDFYYFLEKHSFEKLIKSRKIVPNQRLSFGFSQHLSVDDNIPESLKKILSDGENDILSLLIDKRITYFNDTHKKIDSSYVSKEIKKLLEITNVYRNQKNNVQVRKTDVDIYKIAIKVVCLQTNRDDNPNKELLTLLKEVDFSTLINAPMNFELIVDNIDENVMIQLEECMKTARNFFVQIFVSKIDVVYRLNELSEFFLDPTDSAIKNWYISFMNFLLSNNYVGELYDKKLFLNQNQILSQRTQVEIADNINPKLMEICKSWIINLDYLNRFVDKSLINILDQVYNGFAKKISDPDIAMGIDKKLQNFTGDRQCSDFSLIILALRELVESDGFDGSCMKYFMENKNSLIISTLGTKQMSTIVKIVTEGKSSILDTLSSASINNIQTVMNIINNNDSRNIDQTVRTISVIGQMRESDQQYMIDHLNEIRQTIENRQSMPTMNARRNAPSYNYRPRHTAQNWNTPHLANYGIRPVLRNEDIAPPPPPPQSQKEQISLLIGNMLKNAFSNIKPDEKDTDSFYCQLNKDNNDENGEEYRINCITANQKGNITINQKMAEFAIDLKEKFVIFILPFTENAFDYDHYKEKIRIVNNLSDQLVFLEQYDEALNELREIIESKDMKIIIDNYQIVIEKKYIEENGHQFNDWSSSLLIPKEKNENDE